MCECCVSALAMGCRRPSQRPVKHIDVLLRIRGAAIDSQRSMYAYLYKPLDAASEVVVEVLQQSLPPLEGIAGDLHCAQGGFRHC